MNERDFCYWLQGYIELTNKDKGLTTAQVAIIKEHLALVFDKVTSGSYVMLEPNSTLFC